MRHFRSKSFHLTWVLAILIAGALVFYIEQKYKVENVELSSSDQTIASGTPASNSKASSSPQNLTPSASGTSGKTFLLKIPFSPQAPTANWDELHNEACEETSAIMAEEYFSGNKNTLLSPELVEGQLSKITDWEKQTFGYYLDINSEETTKLLTDFYHLNAKVVHNMTEDEIKQELKQNHVILWPANGRKLGNPNFRQPGPPYHMLVLKGWNSSGIITNDPGTRKGLNYFYTYETLYNANGNWSHNLNAVDEGDKTAIIVWK